jgi:hypothetical protein
MKTQWVAGLAAALVFGGLVAASSARAQQQLDFRYEFTPGDIISGVLDGILVNSNDFVVLGLGNLYVNGGFVTGFTPSSCFGSIDSCEGIGAGYSGNGSGTVTLDGSYMDLISISNNNNGFFFAINDTFAADFGDTVESTGTFAVGSANGYNTPSYDAADWSACRV